MTDSAGSGDHGEVPIELSVVIPAFNASSTIGAQLEALVAQTWPADWEVVVADNGSTDDTREIVSTIAASKSRVRLVDAAATPGPSAARNRGVAAARGRSIAFCDADDVVSPGWLAAIGESLRDHSAVTGPQEIGLLNPTWLWGVYGTRQASELQMFEGIFPFGPTANLGVRRDLFIGMGGFDESLHVGEDLDLCLRLWARDVSLEFVPSAGVHYRYREEARARWRQAYLYGRSAPAVAARLAALGAATPSHWAGAKRWVWLVRRLPSLRTRAGRARWLVVAGTSVGRILGSVQHRWLML